MKLLLFIVLRAFCFARAAFFDRGLNLPSTQGTTRDGAFFPGVLNYAYAPGQVSRAFALAGFGAVRLAVNLETARDAHALAKHAEYIDAAGGRGIICFFETSSAPGAAWPRIGRATGRIQEIAELWRSVHSVFAGYGDKVMYEIFNEPWGYKTDAITYVHDMMNIIQDAGLPHNRVILAGLHGAADVQSVARAGWSGYLAYHVYSFWLPEGQQTQKKYAERVQADLAGLSDRVYITEFGVGLDGLKEDVDRDELMRDITVHANKKTFTGDWANESHLDNDSLDDDTAKQAAKFCLKHPKNRMCGRLTKRVPSFVQQPVGADVAAAQGGDSVPSGQGIAPQEVTLGFLRGLRDGLLALRSKGQGIRGLYHWHGWHNGDTWDFWDKSNAKSSRMIQMIMADLGETAVPNITYGGDPFMEQDYVKDEQSVHMVNLGLRGAHRPGVTALKCSDECAITHCQPGSEATIGGKHLTNSVCTHTCSRHYNGWRFCGAGPQYVGPEAIDCGGCARPAMCNGLPCWAEVMDVAPEEAFIQRHA